MKALLDKYFQQLLRRLRLALGRALVDQVDDSAGLQVLQLKVLAGDIAACVKRYQNYGHTSHPRKNAQAIVIALGANRSELVAIAVDDADARKPDLEEGEHALYSDEGDYIWFKRNRIIELLTTEALFKASSKFTFETPLVDCTDTVNAATAYKVGGTKVVGAQGAVVPDAAGGSTIDAQCRAEVALLKSRIRAHGLIA